MDKDKKNMEELCSILQTNAFIYMNEMTDRYNLNIDKP